jgi:hypothetical protein
MAMIAFTANHTDHSNQNGFQFEFHCDKCGNGFMSSFQANKLGVATELARAAGSIFGGVFGRAASAGAGPTWSAMRASLGRSITSGPRDLL